MHSRVTQNAIVVIVICQIHSGTSTPLVGVTPGFEWFPPANWFAVGRVQSFVGAAGQAEHWISVPTLWEVAVGEGYPRLGVFAAGMPQPSPQGWVHGVSRTGVSLPDSGQPGI